MESIALTLSLLSLCASIFVGLFVRSHLSAYLTEKGKNLASKEDLAHLTELVERVKAAHSAEMERLKAELQS